LELGKWISAEVKMNEVIEMVGAWRRRWQWRVELAADGAVYRHVWGKFDQIKSNPFLETNWKAAVVAEEVWSGECSAAVFSQFLIRTCHYTLHFGAIAN